MENKPIISISDFENKKIVSFRYLDCKDINKLSLIIERDDTGHSIFRFSN